MIPTFLASITFMIFMGVVVPGVGLAVYFLILIIANWIDEEQKKDDDSTIEVDSVKVILPEDTEIKLVDSFKVDEKLFDKKKENEQ